MSVGEFEDALTKIPGVQRARVVGDPDPQEIHLVSTRERSPKQLVRDVQSLATATFGLQIDHRIVSVVQLEEMLPLEATQRPSINNVVISSTSGGGRIDIELKWPDGRTTSGGASAGPSREERLKASTDAIVQALNPMLTETNVALDLESVTTQDTGGREAVLVRLLWTEGGKKIPLIGAALIEDDLVSATTRAVLQAINRKLAQAVG